MSTDTLPAIDAATITALAAELRELLGDAAVSDEEAALERVSVDGSTLSPVIMEKLPLGRAQLVVYPPNAEAIAVAIGAAVRHGVPITPRGKGTGNYGQAIPMSGGLVLDMSKARAIVEVGEGFLIAEAGAPMIQIEQAANKVGQQVLMFPSTVQSSVGGFVSGGSGGTGSIKHGMLTSIVGGYVRSLDVVHAETDAHLIHVEGAEAHNYLHT
jgi:FAD/FMN-containing dehydrogenase